LQVKSPELHVTASFPGLLDSALRLRLTILNFAHLGMRYNFTEAALNQQENTFSRSMLPIAADATAGKSQSHARMVAAKAVIERYAALCARRLWAVGYSFLTYSDDLRRTQPQNDSVVGSGVGLDDHSVPFHDLVHV
jgi:hypothetical protein